MLGSPRRKQGNSAPPPQTAPTHLRPPRRQSYRYEEDDDEAEGEAEEEESEAREEEEKQDEEKLQEEVRVEVQEEGEKHEDPEKEEEEAREHQHHPLGVRRPVRRRPCRATWASRARNHPERPTAPPPP